MIRLQNIPQLTVFNFTQQTAQQRKASINNNLERSPQCDSINFTGKFEKDESEEILPIIDLDAEDIIEVDEADLISDEDCAYIYDLEDQENRLREEEAEVERRRREEDEQITNDMILYGVVVPEMFVESEALAFDDDSDNFDGIDNILTNEDFYPPEDEFPSFDDGLNDFGF